MSTYCGAPPSLSSLDKVIECLFLKHSVICGMIWGHASCEPMPPSYQFCDNVHDSNVPMTYTVHTFYSLAIVTYTGHAQAYTCGRFFSLRKKEELSLGVVALHCLVSTTEHTRIFMHRPLCPKIWGGGGLSLQVSIFRRPKD